MQPVKKMDILLIDHSMKEIKYLKKSFSKINIDTILHIYKNGQDALEYLQSIQIQKTEKYPDMIILDLNVPQKKGQVFLKEVKGNQAFKRIPVIVLTSSKDRQDIQNAYMDFANCYIPKPEKKGDYQTVVNAIEDFWFKIVKLPMMN